MVRNYSFWSFHTNNSIKNMRLYDYPSRWTIHCTVIGFEMFIFIKLNSDNNTFVISYVREKMNTPKL